MWSNINKHGLFVWPDVAKLRRFCIEVKAAYPTGEVALQAADYFLWALQRVFERREDRFLELLWPQCSLIVDADDTREKEYGAYYTKQKPLRAAALKKG